MFHQIDFRIQGHMLELSGQQFLLGELTTDMLDISPAEFKEMYALAEALKAGDEAKQPVQKLHGLLMKRKLFQLVATSEGYGTPEQYIGMVSDIYAFNQTMFWFIDRHIMHLKKLDAENYAAALFDYYSQPTLDKMMVNPLRNGPHSFTLLDAVIVRYVPMEIPGRTDEYAIYEVYSVDYLQAFLKMDFMKAIMAGHIIRRCRNCRRFFLQTTGYKTEYCDRPAPGKPKFTCRSYGAKVSAKEKAKNNPIIRSYNNAFQRITADRTRGNITAADCLKAKAAIKDLRDIAVAGRLSDRELEERLQSANLYPTLNIVRKGGR